MRKITLFLLVLMTSLLSCQMQKVMVNVYTPSKLVFPPEVRSILVTSRYVPATGPYEDIQWGAYESVDSLKWSISESMVDTLAKRLADGKRYLVKVRHLPRMLRHNEATLPEPQPWEGLLNYAKKEYVQALLIIEGFDIRKTPVEVIGSDGRFQAVFSVGVKAAIRIYEPERMRMIDDSVYTFFTEFKANGNTGEEAARMLPDDPRAFYEACSQAAENYFMMINPGEYPAKRSYYADRDSSMALAHQAVQENKWGRAESKWKWLAYNSPDSTIQAKASFNMALACERDGRFNQALGFARRSQRIRTDKRTMEYIGLLEKRMMDLQYLVDQKKVIKKW